MADVKISALSAIAAVAGEDLFAIIDDPSGTPASRKATVTQLATFLDTATQTLTNKSISLTNNTVTFTSAELITACSDETGSGSLVFGTSPTLTTPALGTPSALVATNATGTSGITGLGTQTQDLEMGGFNIQSGGVITLTEQADADADVAGEGQIWVNTATPNELYFTDDAGTDFQLASKTGTHAATESFIVAASDETTVLTTGTGKVEFQMPYAFTLTEVRATVGTAPTTDAGFTVDINEGGVSILSTKITIDATEKTSTTAATAPVISDSSLADNAVITVDIDALSSGGTEAGLKVYLIGYQT